MIRRDCTLTLTKTSQNSQALLLTPNMTKFGHDLRKDEGLTAMTVDLLRGREITLPPQEDRLKGSRVQFRKAEK